MSYNLIMAVPQLMENGVIKMSGRPSKLNDEVIEEICKILLEGNTLRAAAACLNIHEATAYSWKTQGKKHAENCNFKEEDCQLIHPQLLMQDKFAAAVKVAEGMAESALVARVNLASKAGPQYWPAAMTLLERRHPDSWSKMERREIKSTNVNANVEIDLAEKKRMLESLKNSISVEEKEFSKDSDVIDVEPIED